MVEWEVGGEQKASIGFKNAIKARQSWKEGDEESRSLKEKRKNKKPYLKIGKTRMVGKQGKGEMKLGGHGSGWRGTKKAFLGGGK